ncbi:MAG: hypothetical protein MUE98_05910 [Rhodobacteraceae bacterium]|nr:hypothetical protein [Paracoccaceae bacterium]
MGRRAIEADPLYPFADFRTDAASFALLGRYWPAVFAEALGPEEAARVVPLCAADRDAAGFGTPVLCSFWLPRRGRGVRVLFNDPPGVGTANRGRLFLSAGREVRPDGWPLPTGGQVPGPVHAFDELLCIADTAPEVADAVAEVALAFLLGGLAPEETARLCAQVERAWAVG